MLEYLIGSLWGLNWKNVLLCARDTVRDYFRDNNITGTAQTAWWLRLQARGLDIAINPSSGIDLDTITPPANQVQGHKKASLVCRSVLEHEFGRNDRQTKLKK